MRYSIEPKDKIYVKGYGFLSFAKNVDKSVSNKYSQKLLDSVKTSTTDAMKTASKKAIQKTAEATGDLSGNKIANKITGRDSPKDVSVSTELHSKKSTKELANSETEVDEKRATIKKRNISPKERQQIINELRLV